MSNDYNAADLKAIRKATKAAKADNASRKIVIFNLMSSPGGRAYVWEHLIRCHIFAPSFALSALAMAFAEGERNVGLQMLNDIMAFAPDQYIQMTREAQDKEQINGRRTDDDRPVGSSPDDGRDDSGRVESEYDPGHDEGS